MTVRTAPWPTGAPCWTDCAFAPEHLGMHHAKDFYGKLFGWHIKHADSGAATCLKDEHPVAALVPKTDEHQPTLWTVYLACDDADATAAAVQDAGGRMLLPPGEVGEQGRAAYFLDSTGAFFGVWEAGTHTGYGLVGEPGCVAHHSLLTRDLEGSKGFYAAVFGCTYDDTSPDHATIRLADGAVGGSIHLATNLPDEAPPSWLVHFAVADRDSSAQIAQELGAEILMTLETPAGQEATLQGMHGEVFNILALPD